MMKMNVKNLVVCAAILGLSAFPLIAAEMVLDFESPTYTLGTLAGQDHWSAGGSGHQVQNTNVLSGSQSVSSATYDMVNRPLSQDNLSFQDGYIISYLVKMNNGAGRVRLDSSVTEYILSIADARDYSSTQRFYVNGQWIGDHGYLKADEVHLVTLILDFTNQQVDVTIKEISGDNPGNIVSANDIPFTHPATIEQAKNGMLRLRTTSDSQYGQGVQVVDDITFAVPEPATIGLLTFGAASLIRRR